jgi:hypothetical protein
MPPAGMKSEATGISGRARSASVLRSWISGLLLGVLLCWFAVEACITIRRIIDGYTPLPVMDYWRVVEDYPNFVHFDLRSLWRPHNEHRIVFPELVFALDALVAHGLQIVPLAISVLLYFGTWAMLAWLVFRDRSSLRQARSLAVALSAVAVVWSGTATVLAQPFLLQWTLLDFAVVLALISIWQASEGIAPNLNFAGAVVAAVIATYTSANGMVLWLVLICAGLLLRLNRRKRFSLLASAGVSIGLYFVGYRFPANAGDENLLRHPLYGIAFSCAYLGTPWGWMKSPTFGVYIGFAGILAAIVCFVVASRHGLLRTRPAVALFGLYAFTAITAIATAAGRMDASDPRFTNAKASRYLTVAITAWAALILLVIWLIARLRPNAVLAPALVIAILLALGCFKLRWSTYLGQRDQADIQEAALGIESGLRSPQLMRRIFPDPDLIDTLLARLQRNRLSIFYRGPATWIGKPVTRLGAIAGSRFEGGIVKIVRFPSGAEIFGWDNYRRSHFILLVNTTGRIAGLGERFAIAVPRDAAAFNMPGRFPWVGFISGRLEESYRAYVIFPGKDRLSQIEICSTRE